MPIRVCYHLQTGYTRHVSAIVLSEQRKLAPMVKISEFLEQCQMHYTVAKEQATRTNRDGKTVQIPGQFNLVRSTDEQVISPSTVRGGYSAMNPTQLVEPLTPLLLENWITPDAGFLFKDGSHEMLRFRIDGGELDNDGDINGEKWIHYFSIHNHQGGGGKIRGLLHHTRKICLNQTVRLSRVNGFAIRHTGETQKNYDLAIATWKQLKEEIREISKRMEMFASTNVSANDAYDIIRDVYGVKGKPDVDIHARTKNELVFAMQEFANPGRGTYGKSLADVYNAITSTNSHYSAKTSKESTNKRFASIFDKQGSRNKLEAATMSTLLEMAGIE